MKLLIMQFSQFSCYFSAPCSQTPSIYILPLVRETMFFTHIKQWIKSSRVLIFIYLCRRREDKRF